jgi:hypothetical protein
VRAALTGVSSKVLKIGTNNREKIQLGQLIAIEADLTKGKECRKVSMSSARTQRGST